MINQKPIYLEAVTVCVGFSDLLSVTMPFNKSIIDNWIIVTSEEDVETQKLCNCYNIKCIISNEMYENGDIFNKGKAINLGFDQFNLKGYCLQLDSDIILVPGLKKLLSYMDLEEDCLYGVDRIDLTGREEVMEAILRMKDQYSDYVFVQEQMPISTRMYHNEMGYCPIGFFQLFHNSKMIPYPMIHKTAARSDILFMLNWAKNKRRLFPGCFVYHIKTEEAPMGIDWNGRTTKPL